MHGAIDTHDSADAMQFSIGATRVMYNPENQSDYLLFGEQ